MFAKETANVLCRAIEPHDIPAVIDCLTRNFAERPRDYWIRGLAALGRREAVSGRPRYGHLLEVEGAVVGVLLQIFSGGGDGHAARCNLSSWCVDPNYRAFSYLLQARATKDRSVVYFNVTPAPHTAPFLEATGFRRFAAGRMIFAPLLSKPRSETRVLRFDEQAPEAALLSESQRRLLADHVAFGCEAFIGLGAGEAKPFVFQRRRFVGGLVPGLHVIYCQDMADLATFAWPLGRRFARHGLFFVQVNAEQPAPGLFGRFFRRRVSHYFKGKTAPSTCDLAYSELVLFGR